MAVAFIAAYAAAHASPMAPGLAILDAYFLGSSATEVGGVLWQLYLDLDSATTEQELNAAAASLSKVLAGPIADGLLKVLMVGAGKGAGKVAGEFHKRYQFQLPNGIKNGSRLNSGPPVPKIVKRDKLQKNIASGSGVVKKAYVKTADGEYWVAKHKDFTPRGPDIRSHHGIMSAWMEKQYKGYKASEAPTVQMPTRQHYNTTGVYNKWRAEIERRTGSFDWSKVTEADIRTLSEKMFNAGNVPKQVRQAYWENFKRMITEFNKGRNK